MFLISPVIPKYVTGQSTGCATDAMVMLPTMLEWLPALARCMPMAAVG